jgi:hypothetical protein
MLRKIRAGAAFLVSVGRKRGLDEAAIRRGSATFDGRASDGLG